MLGFVVIVWLLVSLLFHLKLMSVQTGSMAPTFSPGDALLLRRMPPSELVPGMVVSYKSTHNPNDLITHRLVSVSATGFRTQGDALSTPDPEVPDSLLVGKAVTVLPHLGRVLTWIQTIPGLVICVYIPAAIITLHELVRLERYYAKSHTYHLYEMV